MTEAVIDPRTLGLPETWEVSKARCCWCQTPMIRLKGLGNPWWCGGSLRCRERQSSWMIQAGGRIVFLPTPRQVEFLASTAPNTLYGGAAGPGKSHAARWGLYSWCLRITNLRTLILRETMSELEQSHLIGRMETEVPALGGSYRGNPFPLATFPNGSVIVGGHMADDAAVKRYLSSEWDIIVAEEATQYAPEPLLELMTRARSSNPQVLAQMGGARVWLPTNPGGPSTSILRQLFMDRELDEEEWPNLAPIYDQSEYVHVPALLDDNPYMDPAYERKLASVKQKWRYQQLRFGDWYALPGVFFDQFSPAIHVERIELHDPQRLAWFRSLDWGYHDPAVVLWWTVLDDGHLHIARERKFKGLTPEEAFREVVKPVDDELGLPRPRTNINTFASPDMWQRRGQVGETLQETARRVGWPLRPAKTERINGWMRVQSLLRPDPSGRPWLTIDPSCKYLIRSLQTAVSDKHDPEDVSQHDDHALEACFAAGTLITTRAGDRPIEDVTLHDEVFTRAGWRAVDAVYRLEAQQTLEILLEGGRTLTATPDHRVWVNGAFARAGTVQYGDMMWTCPVGQPITSALERSGSRRTGIFRRAITSIIATATGQTTHSRTSSASLPSSTAGITTSSNLERKLAAICAAARSWANTVRTGFARMPASPVGVDDTAWMMWSGHAPSVDGRSGPTATTTRACAREPVQALGNTSGRTWPQPAGIAEKDFPLETDGRSGAPLAVVSVRPGPVVPVYNLTVADQHEYFANGLLVANCRYGAMSRPAPKPVGRLPPPRGPFDDDFGPKGRPVVGASTAWR